MSDKIFTLGLTLDEINAVMLGLDQLPHGRVRDLVIKIQIQMATQLSPPTEGSAE